MSDAPPLAPKLHQALEAIPDRAFAGRLRKVYLAAAQAIQRLGDMDLLQYETTTVEGAPDLSLWEEMAPVIRDTVMDVNALLTVAREQLPAPTPGGLADTLMQAIEEAGPLPAGSIAQRRQQEATAVVQAMTQQLAQQVTQLGERMRSPQVVSDRWNLLADLQAFRTRFRELMGDLVYQSASAFAEVSRAEVVPGHQEEVQAAVQVRAAVADLARLVAARIREVEGCEPEDVQWHAQHLERDLDAFGRTSAYKALRAQDKREVIEFRHALGRLALRPDLKQRELLDLLSPFGEFVSSLGRVNSREILVAHDREVWASAGVRLEHAEQLLSVDPESARLILIEAARAAQALYGRDAGLDAFLRKARKGALAELPQGELQGELDKLRQLLASLPMV
jgi:hypothetical protein